MKKSRRQIIPVSILYTLLLISQLIACTRIAKEPSRDSISTYVAQTLTAAPTSPPTSTPPPTATQILPPSATATLTATVGPSPTETPPQLPKDDPRYGINLAQPHYMDNFSSQLTWVGPNFTGAINVWDDGRIRATDLLVDSNIWWSTTRREIDAMNVYAEISAEIGECRGKDSYGFAVRVSGELRNSGYTLEFSCDGHYRARKFVSGTVTVLIEWTPSEAIQTGPNAVNQMGILAKNELFHFFANGEILGEVEDFDYHTGTYGIFASAIETPGITAYFDEFKLWLINP
ncbi:MAG: hypothetical protein P8Z42_13860 [Anaerolineales bacterium]